MRPALLAHTDRIGYIPAWDEQRRLADPRLAQQRDPLAGVQGDKIEGAGSDLAEEILTRATLAASLTGLVSRTYDGTTAATLSAAPLSATAPLSAKSFGSSARNSSRSL
jgi:hypothetical protein